MAQLRWPGNSQCESPRFVRIDSQNKTLFRSSDSRESPQTCDLQFLVPWDAIRKENGFSSGGESPNGGVPSNGGLRSLSATRAQSSAIVHSCGLLGPFLKGIFVTNDDNCRHLWTIEHKFLVTNTPSPNLRAPIWTLQQKTDRTPLFRGMEAPKPLALLWFSASERRWTVTDLCWQLEPLTFRSFVDSWHLSGVPKPGCLKPGCVQFLRGSALLCSFAPFCTLLRTCVCAQLRSFAHIFAYFCVQPPLERPRLGTAEYGTFQWNDSRESGHLSGADWSGLGVHWGADPTSSLSLLKMPQSTQITRRKPENMKRISQILSVVIQCRASPLDN